MRVVNTAVRKKDAEALVTGQPVYTHDIAPKDCLIVKVLRCPHAHAKIEEINTNIALRVPGIECVITYKDVPNKRFTMAGQTYPEPSPYDRLILDQHLRFVGDGVAIVAGKDEKCVNKAMKLIKVTYQVLEPVLDFRIAKDHAVLIHPEENWESLCPVGADNKRNLCATGAESQGDVEKAFADCDVIVEGTYHTKAVQQAMMETFRTYSYLDTYGRLNVVSSTQVPFHARRILANALDIPKSKVRVVKPRIGGGFGAKQTIVSEVYPAIVTMVTKKPAICIYSRYESQIASSPRHEMEVTAKVGADKNGRIKAISVYTLSNTGAYGEHGPTTVGLSGHKSIPLYSGIDAFEFTYDVVYTNHMSAGAYRGYGATQGQFAVESAVNELAAKLQMDPVELRRLNMVREGMVMPAYYGAIADSCTLDKCLERTVELIGWKEKYPCRDMGNGKVRSVGIAMSMQGSAIPYLDKGSVMLKVNDDGFYTLSIGATDMGTGCDTILSQMVAEILECSMDNVIVHGVDTDVSPYDSGSYASSTTYLTGNAAVAAASELRTNIINEGARVLELEENEVAFDGKVVKSKKDEECYISLKDLGNMDMNGNSNVLTVVASKHTPGSPPPFMTGAVEIEVDKETGEIQLLDYVAVVDCGTTINPNLARVQTEGGLVQGIGMALYEDVIYDDKGKLYGNSFMQYKIPTRLDTGKIRVEFDSSYEPTGPFGAKSIGEIVINTPAPAIAHAVYNATGVWHKSLPITPEKIWKSL